MSWFQKVKDWIIKYWQFCVAGIALVFFVIKNWFGNRQQQSVLKNEIDARDKIDKIEKDHDKKVIEATNKASKDHSERVEKIKNDESKNLDEAEKNAKDREKENNNSTGDDLAKRLADAFNADLVEKKDE